MEAIETDGDFAVPPSFLAMPRWRAEGADWLADLPQTIRSQCLRWGPRDRVVFRAVDYWLWGLHHGLTEDPGRCHRLLASFSG
jgi:hypothetical protein